MNTKLLLFVAGGVAAGFFLAGNLAQMQPFRWAYTTGASL